MLRTKKVALMLIFDFEKIFRYGISYYRESFGNERIILEGFPDAQVSKGLDADSRFYYSENLRFFYTQSILQQVVVFFQNYETSYELRLDDEIIFLNSCSTIEKIIYFLNAKQIKWKIDYEQSKLDYLILDLQSDVRLIFYLYSEVLDRIVTGEFA